MTVLREHDLVGDGDLWEAVLPEVAAASERSAWGWGYEVRNENSLLADMLPQVALDPSAGAPLPCRDEQQKLWGTPQFLYAPDDGPVELSLPEWDAPLLPRASRWHDFAEASIDGLGRIHAELNARCTAVGVSRGPGGPAAPSTDTGADSAPPVGRPSRADCMTAAERAIGVLTTSQDEKWTIRSLARRVVCDHQTLRRNKSFRMVWNAWLVSRSHPPLRGSKDGESGTVEAWDADGD